MCGRVNIIDEPSVIEMLNELDAEYEASVINDLPRLNVGPSEKLPIVIDAGSSTHVKDAVWWLLLQSSEKGFKANYQWKTFNARAERLRSSKLYSKPFKQSRCLIPVSAYYEWTKEGEQRYPHMIKPADNSVMAIAGLYKTWDAEDQQVLSCTVVTTEGHPELHSIHKKSTPVLVPKARWQEWLDPKQTETSGFDELFAPRFETEMEVTPVDPQMNSSRIKDHACLSAIGDSFNF